MIEVKTVKAVLFLTESEYIRALRRGKGIMRRRNLDERTKEADPGLKVERKSHE